MTLVVNSFQNHDRFLRLACYYADEWPVNFWSADFSGLMADFLRMREDGFNCLLIALPWAEFQPGLNPVVYNERALGRLREVFEQANSCGLRVMLRLSYQWDLYPAKELPDRLTRLFDTPAVYESWLEYLAAIYGCVSGFDNLEAGLLSWEDFFDVRKLAGLPLAPNLNFARDAGFQEFVRSRYQLSEVSKWYGEEFDDFDKLPLPPSRVEAYRLFLEYFDHFLIERLLKPGAENFPGLILERRADYDPVIKADGKIEWFVHKSAEEVVGGRYLATYYNIEMGQANTGDYLSAAEGLAGLKYFLEQTKESSAAPIFLGQFNFAHNMIGFEGHTSLRPSELQAFLEGAAGLLRQYTIGYGVWGYRDFAFSLVYNPSFALGLEGWTAAGAVSPGKLDGLAGCQLREGGVIAQAVCPELYRRLYPIGKLEGEVVFWACAVAGPARVRLRVAGEALGEFEITEGLGLYQASFRESGAGPAEFGLSLEGLKGRAWIRGCKLYPFVFEGLIYDQHGKPGPARAGVVKLNQALARPSN